MPFACLLPSAGERRQRGLLSLPRGNSWTPPCIFRIRGMIVVSASLLSAPPIAQAQSLAPAGNDESAN